MMRFDDLDRRQVVLGDTTFKFDKMLAPEAWRLFEAIRPDLKEALPESMPSMNGDVTALSISMASGMMTLHFILGVPTHTLERLKAGLYPFIWWARPGTPELMKLSGDEDSAFAELEMIHIYEVLLRSFYINFSASLDALTSMSQGGLDPLGLLLSLMPTSTPSSDTSSTPVSAN